MQYPALLRYGCAVLVATLVFAGCDSVDSNDTEPLDARADIALGAPFNTTIAGDASLGNGASFSEETAYFFPLGGSGFTLTAIQLFGNDASAAHTLSFTYIGEEALGEGTYDVGFDVLGDPPSGFGRSGLFLGNRLSSSYIRATADSLHSYLSTRGTLTVDDASEAGLAGSFSVEATARVSVAVADLEAFADDLRRNPPTDRGPRSLPEPPPSTFTVLETPLIIAGDFSAPPSTFADRLDNRFGWMVQGGLFGRTW